MVLKNIFSKFNVGLLNFQNLTPFKKEWALLLFDEVYCKLPLCYFYDKVNDCLNLGDDMLTLLEIIDNYLHNGGHVGFFENLK